MSNLTEQEIFDASYKGIIAQGGPAFIEKPGKCVYRTEKGRGCAVGVLMTDEEIEHIQCSGWQSASLKILLGMMPIERFSDHVTFLRNLQTIHDETAYQTHNDASFLTMYRERMQNLAHYHGLQVPDV